jgi:hypothetical protein
MIIKVCFNEKLPIRQGEECDNYREKDSILALVKPQLEKNIFFCFAISHSPMHNPESCVQSGNTKRGSITVQLTSCSTGLESAV